MISAFEPAVLPTREHPKGVAPLDRLVDAPSGGSTLVRGLLGAELAERYGGDLEIPLRRDRPTVVANFVETVDGVVALDPDGRTGGGEISGFSPTDRFVMGLLRALADIVLVGAGTVRASSRGRWTPAAVSPSDAERYAELRSALGLAAQPTTLIATGTGRLDPQAMVFQDPTASVVVAGPSGAIERLRGGLPRHVDLETIDGRTPATDLIGIAARRGARLVLSEGGPHLIGELVAANVLDELFLTIAPQLVGRDRSTPRLSLLEGVALWPTGPRWLRLRSVRRGGDHLFLRYGFDEEEAA